MIFRSLGFNALISYTCTVIIKNCKKNYKIIDNSRLKVRVCNYLKGLFTVKLYTHCVA